MSGCKGEKGDENEVMKKGWENYTVGPVAGGHSNTVVLFQFEHASGTNLTLSTRGKIIIMGNARSTLILPSAKGSSSRIF
jgi:hypothetical protein